MNDPKLLLKTYLNEEIIVFLKETDPIKCTLHAFDEHLNVLVSRKDSNQQNEALFIRGENISHVKKSE